MVEGRLQPSRLLTHRFHYSQMAEAYEMAYHRQKSMLGVLFDWRE
jgi:threonine dehydrogenase-like Zn-dependent dehydrogenase